MKKNSEETTAPVAAETKALSFPSDFADMPLDSDIVEESTGSRIPEIRIAQNEESTGTAGAEFGSIVNVQTGEVWDSRNPLEFILVFQKMTRALFPKIYAPGNLGICFSDDGKVPSGDGEDPKPGPCMEKTTRGWQPVCPMAMWSGPRGDRTPPRCSEGIVATIWIPSSGAGAIYRAKRTAMKPWKAFSQKLLVAATKQGAPGDGIPPRFGLVARMYTAKKDNYYLPVFEVARAATPDELAELLSHGAELRALLENARGRDENREEEKAPVGDFVDDTF